MAFYGLSWLLVHWLYNHHTDGLQRFVDALQDGTDPRQAFDRAFPNLDLAAANRDLYEYQNHGKFEEKAQALVETKIDEATLQTELLAEADVTAVKTTLAEAVKNYKGPIHGAEETPPVTPPKVAKRPPSRRIDYAALPPLPKYPCSERDQGDDDDEPPTKASGSAAPETRPAGIRTGTHPSKRMGEDSKAATTPRDSPSPDEIQSVIRAGYDRLRKCYDDGIRTNAELGGRVTFRFVIDRDGLVHDPRAVCTSLPDPAAVSCMVRQFARLKFPKPSGSGTITVEYPILFEPTE